MRLLLAVRVFFRILFNRQLAERMEGCLVAPDQAAPQQAKTAQASPVQPSGRSDSLTLLATLQREARFIDFVQEPLDGYSDEQIGAAVRDIHRDCAAVLQRLFGIVPASSQQEGDEVEVGPGYDPSQWKLTGDVQGEPPFRGRLAHHGWKATRCDLPVWSGKGTSATVLAPVEVELRR